MACGVRACDRGPPQPPGLACGMGMKRHEPMPGSCLAAAGADVEMGGPATTAAQVDGNCAVPRPT